MHLEIFKPQQVQLIPLLKLFRSKFYLAGGTAVALHLGHRYSIDFDLLCSANFRTTDLKNTLRRNNYQIQQILYEDSTQLNCLVNDVKLTFFQFPYQIEAKCSLQSSIKLPDLITLAAMKAFALGGRGKWKDYVDLYHIFKNHHSLQVVCEKAIQIFGNAFSEKLFRQQLAYFDDISFEEEVEYLHAQIPQEEITSYLSEIAMTPL